MNYHKLLHNPRKTSNEIIKKQYTMHPNYNVNKRKSDDLCFHNFINKLRFSQKYKNNKIPINHRLSYEDKNILISSFVLQNINNNNNNNNNNDNKVRDKKKLLNLLNDIYINDSHLSNNKNIIKNNLKESSSFLNMLEKKKTFNFVQNRRSKDNSTRKTWSKKSKKKFSCESNENNKSIKKMINCSNELNDKTNNFLSEKLASKFQSSKGIYNLKNNIDMSNSKHLKNQNINENENILDIIKEDKNEKKSNKNISIQNNERKSKKNKTKYSKNSKNSKNRKDIEIENEKCDNKNNKNDMINSDKKIKKIYIPCLFCCLKGKDDELLSDNE